MPTCHLQETTGSGLQRINLQMARENALNGAEWAKGPQFAHLVEHYSYLNVNLHACKTLSLYRLYHGPLAKSCLAGQKLNGSLERPAC